MLERLEISIIRYAELKENEEFRIDDAYYDKKYINIYDKLIGADKLEKIVEMHDVSSNGSFAFVQSTLNEKGERIVPYIRSGNVGDFFIDSDSLVKITSKAHEILKLSHTKLYDVMMARKGKIGGASIITEKEVDYNCNENVIKLTMLDNTINPFYFVTFFNSMYGIKQVERLATGNVQPWLSIYQIRKLLFLPLSKQFQDEIEKIVRKAYLKFDEYKQKYAKAENILLESLGMKDWTPVRDTMSIRSLREVIKKARIDAEYYQPKYDELIDKLSEHNCKALGEIAPPKKSIEPGSDAYQEFGIPFYRVSNISKEGITDTDIFLDEEKYYTEELALKKDTILFSKDGSIGIAYKIEKDMKAITSGALLHLEIIDETVLPDYLALVLNSIVVKKQAERDAGGSVIQHWKTDEIAQVVIPILDMDLQKIIVELLQESFALKNKSQKLLSKAKQAVEIAIEQSEKEALKLLK